MEVKTQTLCPMGYDKAVFLSLKAQENLKSSLHQLLATALWLITASASNPARAKPSLFQVTIQWCFLPPLPPPLRTSCLYWVHPDNPGPSQSQLTTAQVHLNHSSLSCGLTLSQVLKISVWHLWGVMPLPTHSSANGKPLSGSPAPTAWMLGAQKSLCSQIRTRETRTIKHEGLALQQKKCVTCFLPRQLGLDVVDSLVTCDTVRARPHLIPQTLVYPRLCLLPSTVPQSLEPILIGDVTCAL